MKKDVMQAPPEVKVRTKRFLLRKGKIKIRFELDKELGIIDALYLKQRGAMDAQYFPFALKKREVGNRIRYDALLDVNMQKMAVGFWDVVAEKVTYGERQEAVLGEIGRAHV